RGTVVLEQTPNWVMELRRRFLELEGLISLIGYYHRLIEQEVTAARQETSWAILLERCVEIAEANRVLAIRNHEYVPERQRAPATYQTLHHAAHELREAMHEHLVRRGIQRENPELLRARDDLVTQVLNLIHGDATFSTN